MIVTVIASIAKQSPSNITVIARNVVTKQSPNSMEKNFAIK